MNEELLVSVLKRAGQRGATAADGTTAADGNTADGDAAC